LGFPSDTLVTSTSKAMSRRGRDRMVVGITTTYANNVYHY